MSGLLIIEKYKRENPGKFLAICALLTIALTAVAVYYGWQDYIERHTPRLEVVNPQFYYAPIENGNVTGIIVYVVNQSRAWAKDVLIDFVNDNGYSKSEKVKYFQANNKVVERQNIEPGGGLVDGWMPQGVLQSPEIYKNKTKQYKVDVFIDWGNDKGETYSMVVGYEAVIDNFSHNVGFKQTYKYDTFVDNEMVKKLKRENSQYLPQEMLE